MSLQSKIDFNILLADDNEDHAELTMNALMVRDDIRITYFSSGPETLDYLQQDRPNELPDLILLDIKMPLITGFDLLEFIKNSERLKSIPVIILSSAANPNEIKKAHTLGACDFLTKPIKIGQVAALLVKK